MELETNLKETREGIQRLQENYIGIGTYHIEMTRWWNNDQQAPPC